MAQRGPVPRTPLPTPLLLVGPAGAGKTHLALGLAARWHAARRGPIVVTDGARFARELARALHHQTTGSFRHRHRGARLLVIDSIDDLARRSTALDELAFTLDGLAEAGGAAILTTRRAPHETLPPRLRGRLAGGLQVVLRPPAADTRAALAERFAARRGALLTPAAAGALAAGLRGGVVQVERAVARLCLETGERLARERRAGDQHDKALPTIDPPTIDRPTIDEPLVRSFLEGPAAAKATGRECPAGQGGPTGRERLTGGDVAAAAACQIDAVQRLTARHFGLRASQLRGASRRRAVATARRLAIFLARESTGQSLAAIGRAFGNRDHTTILYNCRQAEQLAARDPLTRQALDAIRHQLASSEPDAADASWPAA